MDIVYVVKECLECEELTYSLRSLVNIPHDKVFIVGGCPKNIDTSKVIHVPMLQIGSKYQNTTNMLKFICEKDIDLSEDFILFNDDFFILKPIDLEDLNCCRGYVKDVIEDYKSRCTMNDYIRGMEQTSIFLNDLGIKNALSYELHIPIILNKKNVLKMFSLPYLSSIGKVIHKRTLYGNLFLKNSKVIEDVKVLVDRYVPIHSDKFLSCDDLSFARVKKFLDKLFPNKSEYEK